MSKQKLNNIYGEKVASTTYVDTDSSKQSRPKTDNETVFHYSDITNEWLNSHERLIFMLKMINDMERQKGKVQIISKIVDRESNTVIGFSIMMDEKAQEQLTEVFTQMEEFVYNEYYTDEPKTAIRMVGKL